MQIATIWQYLRLHILAGIVSSRPDRPCTIYSGMKESQIDSKPTRRHARVKQRPLCQGSGRSDLMVESGLNDLFSSTETQAPAINNDASEIVKSLVPIRFGDDSQQDVSKSEDSLPIRFFEDHPIQAACS